MTNLFLGIIAVAVVVMAVIQVAAIVFAMSAARRIGQAADRIEQDLRPSSTISQTITADAARAANLAAMQMERADRVFADVSRRAEQVMAAVPESPWPGGQGTGLSEWAESCTRRDSGVAPGIAPRRRASRGRRRAIHRLNGHHP